MKTVPFDNRSLDNYTLSANQTEMSNFYELQNLCSKFPDFNDNWTAKK